MDARILRLNLAGQPIAWLSWQEATCIYARGLVSWGLGGIVHTVSGGVSRITGRRSQISLQSIIACDGKIHTSSTTGSPLSNRTLFERDAYQCLYCGGHFNYLQLTRDHVVPTSRGGKDCWTNVVAACRRCNQHKGNRLLHEIDMELLALPFQPNHAEYLALTNSRRILADQQDYLADLFSANYRLTGTVAVS